MRNTFYTLLTIVWMVSIFTTSLFSQDWQDNEKIWSKVFIDQNTFGTGDPNYKLDAPASQTKTFLFDGSGVTVNPNSRPFPSTNSTQSELSVDVALFSEQIIFASANATPCPVGFPLNPNRADGAIDVPITLAQLSWDNGAGATDNELWFGEAGSMVLVHSGSLISS